MSNIRVGVVGVGVMGERHCRVYSNIRHVDLVGLTDLNAERGKAVAESYDTRYFENYRDLLQEVDAINIVTITPAHFDLAMAALSQEVHVLVEKPITETVEQGKLLVAEAKKRKKVLQVGHIERFNPAFIALKNVLQGLSIAAISIRRLSPFDTSNTDVDVIRDLMIHDLDLVVNLVGNSLEGFSAWGRSFSTNAIDHAVANLSFRNGPIATLAASRITEQKVRMIEVTAEGAYIETDLLGKSLKIHRRARPEFLEAAQYRQESIIETIQVPMVEPLVLELRHFIECIQENKPSQVSGQDGLYALQLAKAMADQISNFMILGGDGQI
jgi:predicted dehydrogenase